MRQGWLYRYRLGFAGERILRGATASQNASAYRTGLIIQLQQGEQQGWGEIAPLPGFSQESLAAAQTATQHWLAHWCATPLTGLSSSVTNSTISSFITTQLTEPPLPVLPAAAFGIHCALAELAAQLPATANYQTVPLISDGNTGKQRQDLPVLGLAKYKVARQAVQQEAMEISHLLSAMPQLRLRLDANRGWSPQQAVQFIEALHPAHRLRIDFIEEPCHTAEQSVDFARDTGTAIAWDESLRECDNGAQQSTNGAEREISTALLSLISQPGVAALIIKPMLTGSLVRVYQQIQAAHQRQLAAVISSAVESSLGLTQLARLAHWLTPQTPPGLDTLSLLDAQVIRRWPGSPLSLLTVQALQQLES